MDLATIVAKMSQYGGLLPPGSDKVIKLMKEYPRSTVAVGSFVVIVTLWDRFINVTLRSLKVTLKVIRSFWSIKVKTLQRNTSKDKNIQLHGWIDESLILE